MSQRWRPSDWDGNEFHQGNGPEWFSWSCLLKSNICSWAPSSDGGAQLSCYFKLVLTTHIGFGNEIHSLGIQNRHILSLGRSWHRADHCVQPNGGIYLPLWVSNGFVGFGTAALFCMARQIRRVLGFLEATQLQGVEAASLIIALIIVQQGRIQLHLTAGVPSK